MRFARHSASKDRLKRLAGKIQALARQDEQRIEEARQVEALRRTAAVELYSVCAAFVQSVNAQLPQPMMELAPSDYKEDSFRDPGANMFQINVSGRIVQIEFEATDTPASTEKMRIPYILEGAVRCFNQELLEHAVIPEELLFYCLEERRHAWLLFDPRTHRTTPFTEDSLLALMERLV